MTDSEINEAAKDALIYGKGIIMDGKRVDPTGIYKELSPNQINEAVARKLGWRKQRPQNWSPWMNRHGKEFPIPDYCRSIEAAWEIVERIKPHYIELRCWGVYENLSWTCKIWKPRLIESECVVRASTAPMAICLAYLALVNKNYGPDRD